MKNLLLEVKLLQNHDYQHSYAFYSYKPPISIHNGRIVQNFLMIPIPLQVLIQNVHLMWDKHTNNNLDTTLSKSTLRTIHNICAIKSLKIKVGDKIIPNLGFLLKTFGTNQPDLMKILPMSLTIFCTETLFSTIKKSDEITDIS